MWILLVSCDPPLLEGARRLLAGMGHHVVGAHDPAGALAHLHLHAFDMVAADLQAADLSWASSLENRWDTFDVPLLVFRDPAELAERLQAGSKFSHRTREKSAHGWPRRPKSRLAPCLLPIFRDSRRR